MFVVEFIKRGKVYNWLEYIVFRYIYVYVLIVLTRFADSTFTLIISLLIIANDILFTFGRFLS